MYKLHKRIKPALVGKVVTGKHAQA